MRKIALLLAALPLCIQPVAAQVTVDLNALDRLPATAAPRPVPRPAPPPAPRPKVTLPTAPGIAPKAEAPTAAPPPVSATPAPNPPPSNPSAQVETAPPPPVATPAPKPAATPAVANIRLPFSAEQTDLTPEAAAAIKALVASAPVTEMISYNVLAYANGSGNDPSTPRRLSLSRALAVRGALLGNGVPSSRIFVRALGSQAGDGPADRVDINVLGGNAGGSRP